MKLQYIEFIFENCDSIRIDGKYVGDFLVDDLSRTIKRVACNSIRRLDTANTVVVEIHKDANKERHEFDQNDVEDFKQMTFDRFKSFNDITSICFDLVEDCTEDGKEPIKEHYSYFVDWAGDSDYTNKAQKVYLSGCGNLYLVIADGADIEDFFDLEKIEDEKYMDSHFCLHDVGDKYSNPDRHKIENDVNA